MVSLNTNVGSLSAARLVNINQAKLQKTTERLSTGLRINSAADDPAGMAIAQSMTAKIRGDQQGVANMQQGISALQIAEAGLAGMADALVRMKELAVQASSDLLGTSQRNAIEEEMDALATAIDNISNTVSFNGTKVLNGDVNGEVIQFGSESTATTTLTIADTDATALGVADGSIDVSSTTNAQTAQTTIDSAIATLSARRTAVGTKIQELETLKSAMETTVIATTDARSKVQDADISLEVGNLVRQQILQQSGASALAAANFNPQFVLKLLA